MTTAWTISNTGPTEILVQIDVANRSGVPAIG